jgi:hypothetical protein
MRCWRRHGEETRLTHKVSSGAAEPSNMCWVSGARGCRNAANAEYKRTVRGHTHPNMRSGCAIKSVMRSSILLGSRTNVGKVTFERSMPTLWSCLP